MHPIQPCLISWRSIKARQYRELIYSDFGYSASNGSLFYCRHKDNWVWIADNLDYKFIPSYFSPNAFARSLKLNKESYLCVTKTQKKTYFHTWFWSSASQQYRAKGKNANKCQYFSSENCVSMAMQTSAHVEKANKNWCSIVSQKRRIFAPTCINQSSPIPPPSLPQWQSTVPNEYLNLHLFVFQSQIYLL